MLWLDGQLGPDVDQQAFLTLTEGILELKMRQINWLSFDGFVADSRPKWPRRKCQRRAMSLLFLDKARLWSCLTN